MSLADELGTLETLRMQGVLSQAEVDQAKRRLLDGPVYRFTAPASTFMRKSLTIRRA